MSDVLGKQKVSVAAVNHAKLDVSGTHITTGSFNLVKPVYYRHMLPKEHLRGNASVMCRLAPLAVPTYGRARINMRYFFVPFRTVFPNWNEFITDTIASNFGKSSLVPSSPVVSNSVLVDFFLNTTVGNYGGLIHPVDPNTEAYDLLMGNGNYYKFTYIGRQMMTILQSLGYRVVWDTKSDWDLSALPLLCYAKIYLDWYSNSAYMDNVEYRAIEQLLKYNDPSSQLVLTEQDVRTILLYCIFVCYDGSNEYITTAWDNPMSPNNGNGSTTFSILDITNPMPTNNAIAQLNNGTPYMAAASPLNVGTQYIHDALRSMTDYIKRHQLSGARAVDRFLTQFGVNLDSAKVNRSIFVGTNTQDVQIGDVTSTANTAGAGEPSTLGDFAGRGYSQGGDDIDFVADEFGIFIVMSSILPSAGYYQGIDRNLFHIDKLDFFNPEFDNLGCQAISKGEVYISSNGQYADTDAYNGVFGYAPRYCEYKVGRNFVTGDFLAPATMDGGDSWNLMRKLDDGSFPYGIQGQVHSFNFTRGLDGPSYDRIFQNTSIDGDKFYMVYHFALEALSPCKSLFDSYDFEDESKKILLEANGTKVN